MSEKVFTSAEENFGTGSREKKEFFFVFIVFVFYYELFNTICIVYMYLNYFIKIEKN